MRTSSIETISARKLRDQLETRRENEYTLVDVRQPEEYAVEHIPGAVLLPLPTLEQRLHEIDPERDVFIYCRSGNRSLVAARFVADSGMGPSRLVNVGGGITAWFGKTLKGFPQLTTFPPLGDEREALHRIFDLEKGAFRYYEAVTRKLGDAPFGTITGSLLAMERAHAESAYDLWSPHLSGLPPFEEMFETARGDIVEGGETYDQLIEKVRDRDDGDALGLAELALDIEIHAYDLYRVVAEMARGRRAHTAFLSLAEQEKAHIRLIARGWK